MLLMAAVMGLMCYACSDSYEEFQNEEIVAPPSTGDEDDDDVLPAGNPGAKPKSGG